MIHNDPLPTPAYLGATGPDRIRSDEFATVVLEAVAAHRAPLASTAMPAGPYAPPTRELAATREVALGDVRDERDWTRGQEDWMRGQDELTTVSAELAITTTTTSVELTTVSAELATVPAQAYVPDEPVDAVAPVPAPVWPVNPAPEQASSARPAPPVQNKKRKEAPEQWPPPEMRAMSQARSSTARVLAPRVAVPGKRTRHLRRPGAGLAWMLVFALLATFFAYTAAEPTWLALGHATRGTATVLRCEDAGVFRRCDADFVSGHFEAPGVALVGADHVPGTSTSARMVGAKGRIAYAGSNQALLIRGLVGLLLVLLCGLGISWVTGAGRLATRRMRNVARLLSVALPLLIALGVLAATY